MRFSLTLTVFVIAFSFNALARADYVAYSVTNGLAGNTSFGQLLGLDFTVNEGPGIKVTALGVFDNLGDGFVASHAVEIYNTDTQTIVSGLSVTIPTGTSATLLDGHRFVSITPVILAPGNYSVVTQGLSGSDQLYLASSGASVLDPGGGDISFTGTGRFGVTAGVFPSQIYPGDSSNPFAAGSFQYLTVPEPTAILLFGLGFGVVLFGRIRKTAIQKQS